MVSKGSGPTSTSLLWSASMPDFLNEALDLVERRAQSPRRTLCCL